MFDSTVMHTLCALQCNPALIGDPMQKLIDRYRANPTNANARAVLAYDIKHPFASLLLDKQDVVLLARLLVTDLATDNWLPIASTEGV